MATPIRLTIIGAGSAQFSLGLIRDICLTEGLYGSTIILMDIDKERLHTIYTLAKRYVQELAIDLRFEKTIERDVALRYAEFVVNAALEGGHKHEESERLLFERHGYYRGVDLASQYRQFDLMLGLARDMERYCPDAWLIQIANPVFDGCTLVTRQSKIKTVGLCHGSFCGIQEISRVLGLEREYITFEAPGFNHCVWLTHFRYKGKNAYPLLDQWIREESEQYWRDWQPEFVETQLSPAAIHMYHLYGVLPLGDTSRGGTCWWYNIDHATKVRWWGPQGGFDSAIGWTAYLEKLQQNIQSMYEATIQSARPVTDIFSPVHSGEQMIPIINALVNDQPGQFIVNVPNTGGALHGIPENVVVELPAIVDGRGIRPLVVSPLPDRVLYSVLLPQWQQLEQRLVAHLTGDRRYLLDILLQNRHTQLWEQAENVLQDLLAMSDNEKMARHYKS